MRVYAHYYPKPIEGEKDKSQNDYRWRTLLQFGTSWEVIGSVVMKNPGSASPSPKEPINDIELLSYLKAFSAEYDWYSFTPDNTMQNIERLFQQYYRQNTGRTKLDGIIQIFNLMNVRDPNLEMALEKNKKETMPFSKTTDKDIEQLVAPIYLGWGGLGFNSDFRNEAERFFNAVIATDKGKYLQPDFKDNRFYHPQYLMGRGKYRPYSQYLLNAFCQNTTAPVYEHTVQPVAIYDKKKIFEVIETFLQTLSFNEFEKKKNVCRFKLNEQIGISVSTSEKGYVGIRHNDIGHGIKYDEDCLYPNERQYRTFLETLDYDINSDIWLGKKDFKVFGLNTDEIIEGIKEDVASIIENISK